MENRLDSRKLRYFVEAVEQGSLNRAAGSLRVSQPALSKAVRLLELDLGVPLLERTSEGVRSTSYGKALYSYAKAVLTDLAQRPEVELIAELRRGTFDFALGLIRGGEHAEGLRERALLFDQRKLIVRARHPLAKLKKVRLSDLAEYPWIMPSPGTIHRAPMEQLFRDAGLMPPVSLIEGGSL